MSIKEKLGLKIKELRTKKSFSIQYLSDMSNIDRNYLSDIENGKRKVSIDVLEKIAIGLEIDFYELFQGNM